MIRSVRFFALGLAIACCFFSLAMAESTVELDSIGVRYAPAESEICVTRDVQPEEALAKLGVDDATLLDSMLRDNAYLIVLLEDGRQVSLTVEQRPAELTQSHLAELDAAGKQQFLSLLARKGNYAQAAWQNDLSGYALFSSSLDETDSVLAYETLALSTLYLGKIYTFRTDVIGREPDLSDTTLLLNVAKRTLLLGATSESEPAPVEEEIPLALPEQPVLSEQAAAITTIRESMPLTIQDVPSIIGTTEFTLSGTTQADVSLKYSVNGTSSSRFKSDENGNFSANVRGLKAGDNKLELIAYRGKDQTRISFEVTVDWQLTPMVLANRAPAVESDTVTIEGLTLPGAKISLIRKSGTSNVTVAEDGSFSCEVKLKQAGENTFTLRALADGYKRNDMEVTATRLLSDEELLATLQGKVKTVSYAKLLKTPASFKGKVVQLTGTVGSLCNSGGQPRFTLTTDDGNAYIVLCSDLLAVHEGDTKTLLGTLTGELLDGSAPAVTLALLLE